jgi:hypothetical protein
LDTALKMSIIKIVIFFKMVFFKWVATFSIW